MLIIAPIMYSCDDENASEGTEGTGINRIHGKLPADWNIYEDYSPNFNIKDLP